MENAFCILYIYARQTIKKKDKKEKKEKKEKKDWLNAVRASPTVSR
eukprot:COSAG02_NODE_17524_length_997_cov_215.099109_2_plen_45_part_01